MSRIQQPFGLIVLVLLSSAAGAISAGAQPAVVATAEGQIGETPPNPGLDKVGPPGFAPVTIPGSPIFEGNVALGRIFDFGGLLPPPDEASFIEDRFHNAIFPAIDVESFPGTFVEVDRLAPQIKRWPSDPDTVALAFAIDGLLADSLTAEVAVLDIDGSVKTIDVPIEDIDTAPFPSEDVNDVDIAVDDAGRLTVVFTELPSAMPPKVMAQAIDGLTGDLLDLVEVSPDGADAEVAFLKPNGERMVIPSVDFTGPDLGQIQGNFLEFDIDNLLDVEPEIAISTTLPPVGNFRPAVAADPVTGAFTVTWDHVTGVAGDPADVRGRRYDGAGLPIGDDFLVNVKPILGDDDSQGQSDVAYGPGGLSVVTWAADGTTGDPDTDIFARVFLADGSAIVDPSFPLLSGQFLVNTGSAPGGPLSDRQDRPRVSFLPEPDSAGRPQFAVVWRDVGGADGSDPNGTGASYRCFSIDGLEDVSAIFADGFESGDTSSWSSATP